MADTLLDQLLSDMEKSASTEEETKQEESKVAKEEEKKEEKKEEKAEKKEEKKEEEEKMSSAVQKIAELGEEKIAALEQYIDKLAEEEKVAELAKQAEELETQGRFMYHGFAKEQIKVAYALGQIEDKDVMKVAETLNWDVDDIFKGADVHKNLVGEQPEPSVEGMGTQGGPAANEIKANKTIQPDASADGQTERKQDGASELGQIKNIINAVKNVKKDPGNLEMNG